MSDSKIIAQLIEDFKRHSSGESVLRAQLTSSINALEAEVESLHHLPDTARLLQTVAAYESVLKQIADEAQLTRVDCALIAKKILEQNYEHETP